MNRNGQLGDLSRAIRLTPYGSRWRELKLDWDARVSGREDSHRDETAGDAVQESLSVPIVCKLLCQLPTRILHISDLPRVHPARVTRWIQGEPDEMLVSP
jgi:hypothetical protein